VRDGDGGPGRRGRGRPGAERADRLGAGGVRRRRLGEEHGQAAVGAALAVVAVADAGEQRRRRAGHGNVLRRVAVVVAAVRGGGHQVVQHGEAGLAGEHVVVVLVLASVPRRRRHRGGSSSSSLRHQGSSRGRDGAVGVVVLPAAREVGRQQRAAGHDPVGVVAREVEVGDGVEAAELDGRDVVRLRRLLLRAEGAEVEVLVARDAADARLPPPVLVVPACTAASTCMLCCDAVSERARNKMITLLLPGTWTRPVRSRCSSCRTCTYHINMTDHLVK
jgi:hypothetical protein